MQPSGPAVQLPIWKSCHWTAKAKLLRQRQLPKSALTFFLVARGSTMCCRSSRTPASSTSRFRVGSPVIRACLKATIDEIVESAKTIAGRDGVHGLDLLAYRSAENVPELMKAVCAAVTKPVYIAGSIDTPERIAVVQSAGAAGFTIGTAALDGKYPANGNDLPSQLTAIIRDVAALNKHLSPIHKKNLSTEFAGLHAPWAPKVEVHVNNMQIKVAMFKGASNWSFRQHDDRTVLCSPGTPAHEIS